MVDTSKRVSALRPVLTIPESAVLPVVPTELIDTNKITLSSLRDSINFENAFETLALGISKTVNGDNFFVYENTDKLWVLEYQKVGSSAVAVNDDDGKQKRLPTQRQLAAISELTELGGAGKIPLNFGGTVADLQTYLSFDMFKIDNTGTTDVTDKIKAVFALSELYKIPIKQNGGKYVISGSDKLRYNLDNGNFDMRGSRLIPAVGYTGGLTFYQTDGMVTYDVNSDVVKKINASLTDIGAGSKTLDSLANDTTLNNSMIIIEFKDDLYTYNSTGVSGGGQTVKYFHVTRLSSNGRMDHSLPYTATGITAIRALPLSGKNSEINLPDIDYINKGTSIPFNVFYASNFDLKGGRIINKPITDVGNRHVIDIQYCYGVRAENIYDPSPSSTFTSSAMNQTTASYTFHHAWTCNFVARNINSIGYGWGAISAAGYITDTTYINCASNNYDSHGPIIGYYRIINSIIGDTGVVNMGVLGSTVEIIDSVFELGKGSAEPYNGRIWFPSLIQTRTTSGGVSDSKLIFRNVKVVGYWKNYVSSTDGRAGIVQAHADNFTDLPTGSMMSGAAFTEIDIDGYTVTDPRMANILINPVFSTKSGVVYHPTYVRMHNVNMEGGLLKFNMVNFKTRSDGTSSTTDPTIEPINIRIDLSEINVYEVVFQRHPTSLLFNFRVNADKVKNKKYGVSEKGTIVRSSARGIFTFSNSEISQITTTDGATEASQRIDFILIGGTVKSDGVVPILTTNTSFLHRFSATGTDFIGDYSPSAVTSSNLILAQWCKLNGARFFNYTTGAVVSNLAVWLGSISNTTFTYDLYIAKGNVVTTTSLQSSITLIDVFTLNYPGSGRLLRTLTTLTQGAENTLSGTATITIDGTDRTGTTSTKSNSFSYYLAVGTRDSQAYISSIYSQLNLTGIYVG